MLATALLLARLALAAPPARDVETVLAILVEEANDPAPNAARLSARLGRLGSAAIPELLAVLARPEERTLTELEEEGLIGALSSLPIPALRAHAREKLASRMEPDERRALLLVLARTGTREDLALARAATQAGPESAGLAAPLEELVTAILGRDPTGMEPVRRWILQAPPGLDGALVRGAAASGCETALVALADLLGFDRALDRVLLPEIGRLAARAPKPIDGAITDALAEYLASDDAPVVREAALALGHAEDFAALPALIELLEHPERSVREALAFALPHITGQRFGPLPERWRAWHRNELSWLRELGTRLRPSLSATSAKVVVQALGEISQHRLRRHELAAEVTVALAHESPLARRLACLTLARLGSSVGVPALSGALEDPDPSVREAARNALRLLGVEPVLPPELEQAG
jgi:hypothetical protein